LFETSRRLFDRYYCHHLANNTPGFDEHLAQEARVRLCQVHRLFDRVLELEQHVLAHEVRDAPSGDTVKLILHDVARPVCEGEQADLLRPYTPADELRVMLESVYYNACRVRGLLQDSAQGLPDLQQFESAGVRDVRNHLIEHPSRHKGVKVMAIALGGPVGPQLKPLRHSGDPSGTRDQGLRVNAREFCELLEATLTAALDTGAS